MPHTIRTLGGFAVGLVLGALMALTISRKPCGSQASAEAFAIEIARRETAEKTAAVLHEIVLGRGGRTRCVGARHGDAAEAQQHTVSTASQGLKIFVYNLPADFNTNMLDPRLPRKFDCMSSMYSAEVLIHEQLLRSEHRTTDPEQADFFYVPIYMSCYRSLLQFASRVRLKDRVGILRGRGLTVEETLFEFFMSAIDYLRDEEPYWERQEGRDHIFTFTHDYGACFTYLESDTLKPERLQVRKSISLDKFFFTHLSSAPQPLAKERLCCSILRFWLLKLLNPSCLPPPPPPLS